MGKINSRQKGHDFERKIAEEMRELGYKDCKTSRYESKMLDDAGVDLTNTTPFNIQLKAVEKGLNPFKVLDEMPKDSNFNVIFHKKNRQGELVYMTKSDFYKLIIPYLTEL